MIHNSEETNHTGSSLFHNQTLNDEERPGVTFSSSPQGPNERRKPGLFSYMEFEKRKNDRTAPPEQPFTWKGKLRNFLHSKPCHIAVIILTLVDVVLVMVEIILDLKNAEKCEGEAEEPVGAEIVHYMSIAILSIFLVEIGLKLVADWQHFWDHKMEIFDAFVVIVAFACDVALSFIGTEALAAVGLLIMLRLWRVVRVINGIILTVKSEGDERVHALKHQIEEMEGEANRRKEEIKKLRNVLSQNGIEVEEEPELRTESYVSKDHALLESIVGTEA